MSSRRKTRVRNGMLIIDAHKRIAGEIASRKGFSANNLVDKSKVDEAI